MKRTSRPLLGFRRTGVALLTLAVTSGLAAGIGVFESATDVGQIHLPGASAYLAEPAQYRITGSGKNMWFAEDAFQFLSKKLSGDLMFSMDVGWESAGKEPHRKACALVRQTLDADSPYVDVAVHGDGLIELQYRMVKGGTTYAARTPIQVPATVKLERAGDVFTAFVSKAGGDFSTHWRGVARVAGSGLCWARGLRPQFHESRNGAHRQREVGASPRGPE